MLEYDESLVDRYGSYGISLIGEDVVRKEASFSQRSNFEFIRNLVNHLIQTPDPMVVPVFRFETLEEDPPKTEGAWGTYKYAYEMKRLPKLSEAEKTIISRVIGHYKPVPTDTPDPTFQRYWKENSSLMEFMNKVLDDGNYTDLHSGNFLKDHDGSYRIIDLEGFYKYPLIGNRQ
jgi:hypothetical protein